MVFCFEDVLAMIMKAINRWDFIKIDFTIARSVTSGVRVLARTSATAAGFRAPVDFAQQLDGNVATFFNFRRDLSGGRLRLCGFC